MKTLSLILLSFLFIGCSHHGHKKCTEGSCQYNKSACNGGSCKFKKDSTVCNSCHHKGVSFLNLKDGDTVKSPFTVKFGIKGMKVRAAGEIVEGTGHHHLIIDKGVIAKGAVVPNDKKHLHFGKGQTETSLKLSKGKYKLTLQFANGAHISYGKEMSKTITVNVE